MFPCSVATDDAAFGRFFLGWVHGEPDSERCDDSFCPVPNFSMGSTKICALFVGCYLTSSLLFGRKKNLRFLLFFIRYLFIAFLSSVIMGKCFFLVWSQTFSVSRLFSQLSISLAVSTFGFDNLTIVLNSFNCPRMNVFFCISTVSMVLVLCFALFCFFHARFVFLMVLLRFW